MSFSVSRLSKALASLRCRRSVLSSASHPVGSFSSDRKTSFSSTATQSAADEWQIKQNLSSFWRPNQSVPYNMKKEPNEKEVEAILSDFMGKLPVWDPETSKVSTTIYYDAELWKLLTSERLKDLGVHYNPTPIPSKEKWRASWYQDGKPSWLGNILTKADEKLYCAAAINGYVDEERGKGGYGVMFVDNYARPKVASFGVSLTPQFPLVYYHLQGIRSALQLAVDNGFGCNFYLGCDSEEVQQVFDVFESFSDRDRRDLSCDDSDGNGCIACLGIALSGVLDGYFDLLFPVVKEIHELSKKLNNFEGVVPESCRTSGYLAMHQRTTTVEMKRYNLLDGEEELYEMVLKPDEFPEELVDTLYDEVFKGYRFFSDDILEERVDGASSAMNAVKLFDDNRSLC